MPELRVKKQTTRQASRHEAALDDFWHPISSAFLSRAGPCDPTLHVSPARDSDSLAHRGRGAEEGVPRCVRIRFRLGVQDRCECRRGQVRHGDGRRYSSDTSTGTPSTTTVFELCVIFLGIRFMFAIVPTCLALTSCFLKWRYFPFKNLEATDAEIKAGLLLRRQGRASRQLKARQGAGAGVVTWSGSGRVSRRPFPSKFKSFSYNKYRIQDMIFAVVHRDHSFLRQQPSKILINAFFDQNSDHGPDVPPHVHERMPKCGGLRMEDQKRMSAPSSTR